MDDDDIVVCPDCGTPMHRKCYDENGSCANSFRHGTYDFTTDTAVGAEFDNEHNPTVKCANCNYDNPKNTFYCMKCGAPLNGPTNSNQNNQNNTNPNPGYPGAGFNNFPNQEMPINIMDPLGGVPKDAKLDDDITAEEMGKFVKQNPPYFVRVFNNIVNFNKSKFNFSAAIFSGGYLLYRKKYLLGAIISFIELAILTFTQYLEYMVFTSEPYANIMSKLEEYSQSGGIFYTNIDKLKDIVSSMSPYQAFILALPFIFEVILVVIMVVMGLSFNRMYFNHCKKQIKKVKANLKDNESLDDKLSKKGGINLPLAICVFACFLIVYWLPGILLLF